jgi:hypothetical protein
MSTDISPQERWRDACDCFIDGYKDYTKDRFGDKLFFHVLDVARAVAIVEPEAELFLNLVGHCKTFANAVDIICTQARIEETNGFLWYLAALSSGLVVKEYIQKAIYCNYTHALAFARNVDGTVDIERVLVGYEKGCRHACFQVARFYLLNTQDMDEYRRHVLKSAKAGFALAIKNMISDPVLFATETNRWRWISCLVFKGHFDLFLSNLKRISLEQQHLTQTIDYLIGKCIYYTYYDICFAENIPRDQLREFYLKQVKAARAAVHAASACFLRMGVYKDLRVLLCQWVWAGRDEANY